MNMEIEYAGGTKFTAKARSHIIVCDQPVESGGLDTGMTPPELLLASLGTCVAYYALQYSEDARLVPRRAEGVCLCRESQAAGKDRILRSKCYSPRGARRSAFVWY